MKIGALVGTITSKVSDKFRKTAPAVVNEFSQAAKPNPRLQHVIKKYSKMEMPGVSGRDAEFLSSEVYQSITGRKIKNSQVRFLPGRTVVDTMSDDGFTRNIYDPSCSRLAKRVKVYDGGMESEIFPKNHGQIRDTLNKTMNARESVKIPGGQLEEVESFVVRTPYGRTTSSKAFSQMGVCVDGNAHRSPGAGVNLKYTVDRKLYNAGAKKPYSQTITTTFLDVAEDSNHTKTTKRVVDYNYPAKRVATYDINKMGERQNIQIKDIK